MCFYDMQFIYIHSIMQGLFKMCNSFHVFFCSKQIERYICSSFEYDFYLSDSMI